MIARSSNLQSYSVKSFRHKSFDSKIILAKGYFLLFYMASERAKDTRNRLEKCWENDVDWNLYPSYLKEVS